MTERYNGLIVALTSNIREDDAESLMDAIRHFKGVLSVSGNVSSPDSYVAERRAYSAISTKLWDALKDGY